MSHADDDTRDTTVTKRASTSGRWNGRDSIPMVSRRGVIKGAAVASSGALLLGWAAYSSDPVLALSGEDEWVAAGAEITSHDGSVDSITFGDPDEEGDPGSDDNRIVLDWSGFEDDSHSVEFDVLLRGSDADEEGWTTDQETYESIIVGEADDPASVSISGSSGEETFTWYDVFGMHQPADVETHSAIDLDDFEAGDDGSERERELEVQIEAYAPGPDITATAAAEATITVTNESAEVSVGGQGTFEIESDTEV